MLRKLRFAKKLNTAEELNRKTKWIRTLLSIVMLVVLIYGSYVMWWRETIIETALQTPEGREALAREMINALGKRSD